MRSLVLPILLLLAGCRGPASTPRAATPFDWLLGDWHGARVDDETSAPMTLRVRPVLGGAGQLEELEVVHADGVYRGLHVRLREVEHDRWVSHYANAVRGRLVPLELQRLEGEWSEWRSIAPERTRESRLTYERPAPGRWRRTQSVSEDGGLTWRVLFVDEVERTRSSFPQSGSR